MPYATTPPGQTTELHRWSLSGGTELSTLRRSLHQQLLELQLVGADEVDLGDDVALVATELAANALEHGLPPTTVRLLRTNARFILDIADHAPQTAPQAAAASLTRPRGRGLHIAHTIAQQVGWYITDTAKHIWAAFPITKTP